MKQSGMGVNSRIRQFLKKMKITVQAFESSTGKTNRYISHIESPAAGVLADTVKVYPDLNLDWLITGEGDMLKSSGTMIGSNQRDGNKIEYKNGGDVGVGNTVNVALPESGIQKIIKSDGIVELTSIGSNDDAFDKLQMENEALKEKISHPVNNMQLKDELIASLRDTIELLKHRQ